MRHLIEDFNNILRRTLGIRLRGYQSGVIEEIVNYINTGDRFLIISMPTGSGKTVLEIFTAFYFMRREIGSKVLVIEPTRFLCDQMALEGRGPWSKVFGDLVGKEYEGRCEVFASGDKKVIISTPKTALKCLDFYKDQVDVVIVDEVHHIFGRKDYEDLLSAINPRVVTGFTALLTSERLYRMGKALRDLGQPKVLSYDFKDLEEIDSEFRLPKAIADFFDTELNNEEDKVYEKLIKGALELEIKRPGVIGFLESVLSKYGKKAFCESLSRLRTRGTISGYDEDVENLCGSDLPSHKARGIEEVLEAYGLENLRSLAPVLIFTSRRATAEEIRTVIANRLNVPYDRIAILTGEVNRRQRIEVISKAKSGDIDVIVSTLVGEEGIDIPEAGLLIMTDVPESPLRFYQRLGRLIRMSSRDKVKYLAFLLTPRTIEYRSLAQVLLRLSAEGVDISYVVTGIDKALGGRILEEIGLLSEVYGTTSVPFSLLAANDERGDIVADFISEVKEEVYKKRRLPEKLRNLLNYLKLSDEDVITTTLLSPSLRNKEINRIIAKVERRIKSRLSSEIEGLLDRGELMYVYDVEYLSDILSRVIYVTYLGCVKRGEKKCRGTIFKLERKGFLKLVMRLFRPEAKAEVFREMLDDLMNYSKLILARGIGNKRSISIVLPRGYNSRTGTLLMSLTISADVEDMTLEIPVQVVYPFVANLKDKDFVEELYRLNLVLAGSRAFTKFLERVETVDVQIKP